ncbi:MAG TPA: rod shape-determining protein MreD [Gaiellaceae bacterium]|nr:rod shape-determining protein MreD [Gaiellaceae bacterium]
MSNGVRTALLVFVAALLQASVFSSVVIAGGAPDVLLVTLISIALLRGSVPGAAAGFAGGLIVDVATLGTLGVNALLLTVAGYWAGRYGETTGRDRLHAPLLSIVVITLLVGVGAYALYFLLGEDVSARHALVTTLLPGLGLNLIVGGPIYGLCRWVLKPAAPPIRAQEVEVVV